MENQDQQITPKQEPNTSLASAAKTVASAITSAAKAASGDVAGAIATLLKDENVRKVIASILLGVCFLSIFGGMVMGSAITGTIENLQQGYIAKYDQLYEDYAIAANGSTFTLYTFDHQQAQEQAMGFAIAQAIRSLFQKNSPYDNSNLPEGEGTVIGDDIYQATLEAVKDQESFIGEAGAVQKRLDMIKGRVEQRGKQLAGTAAMQYEISALGMAIGEYLENVKQNPVLFAGVDIENSSISINTKAFELSDVQALKILAAYSIQNDCNIQNIDMWDLMNYCGWYASDKEDFQVDETKDTIYNSTLTATYGMEIGGVVQDGEEISTSIRYIDPPKVPYWDGSCAAQWYYEEIAQLRKQNEQYESLEEREKEKDLEGMIHYQEDSQGRLIISNFEKLSNYDTFGLVDRIFTASTASIVTTRTEYHGADEWAREALSSLGGTLRARWSELFEPSYESTSEGNTLYRDSNGDQHYILNTSNSANYYIKRRSTGWTSSVKRGVAGGSITFSDLAGNATYDVYRINGSDAEADEQSSWIDSFTTGKSASEHEAYKIQVDVNVTFAGRSADSLIESVLGLWPGNLNATETGSNGTAYAEGYADNELLAKTWTDTYADPSGQTHTVSFKRQSGYQAEAYKDYIMAIAEALGIKTGSLFGGDFGYGQSIIDLAMAEYEFYHANGLYEGGRYWDMVRQANGLDWPADTPWCACFIMTCAWQCDLLGPGKAWDGVDWIYYCTGLYYELVDSGVATGYCTPGSDYKPVPGDIVFFNTSVTTHGLEHVGFVKEVTEDGCLVTIEGNKSDILKIDTYGSYRIGSYAYGNCIIAAYCHPTYPATYRQDPVYETVSNGFTPSVSARLHTSGRYELLLAGLGRFRWSQIPAVLDSLQESHPELYRSEMRTAYNAGDKQAFVKAWNDVVKSDKKEKFMAVQRQILNQLYAEPIIQAVKSSTGFNWRQTAAREDILLGIITTTDQQQACISILASLGTTLGNTATDAELTETLRNNNYLYSLFSANKDILWPNDSFAQKTKWCLSIQSLADKVYEVYVEDAENR